MIETKQACDQEKGTEWYLGRCLVSGEQHAPETPEEVAAVKAVNEAQSGYDDSLHTIHSRNHGFKQADKRLSKAKEELKLYENHHGASGKRAERLRSQVDDAKACDIHSSIRLKDDTKETSPFGIPFVHVQDKE